MFWLIETKEKLEELREKKLGKVFAELIPLDNKIHPSQNDISCLYLRGIEDSKGYLLPTNHHEAFPIDIQDIYSLLQQYEEIFVRDKKEFLHYMILRQLSDTHFISPTDIQVDTPTQNHYYRKHPNLKNLNTIIPIVKHYEYCEQLYSQLKHTFNLPKPAWFDFYNNKATHVFWWIEQEGIKTNPDLFDKYFGVETDKTYTQFNLKTLTTRPSNTFNGINYAALDKKSGCREALIPANDFFLEIDISAYHPTLLAQMVGYKFGSEDIHQSFADMYGVDYKTAKELTFKQLYGGVFEEYKELDFFKKVEEYMEEATSQETFACQSNFEFKTGDKKKQTLLNYILQNTETYYNVLILEEIIRELKESKTRIVHYTYDSFLLDVDKTEREIVENIKNIFKKYDFNIKITYGVNYHSLEPI